MSTLFLNYNADTKTVSVDKFRNNGYVNFDVIGLVDDIIMGVSGCCDLEGALDAVRDGSIWAGASATAEILEMIDSAICDFYDNN